MNQERFVQAHWSEMVSQVCFAQLDWRQSEGVLLSALGVLWKSTR